MNPALLLLPSIKSYDQIRAFDTSRLRGASADLFAAVKKRKPPKKLVSSEEEKREQEPRALTVARPGWERASKSLPPKTPA